MALIESKIVKKDINISSDKLKNKVANHLDIENIEKNQNSNEEANDIALAFDSDEILQINNEVEEGLTQREYNLKVKNSSQLYDEKIAAYEEIINIYKDRAERSSDLFAYGNYIRDYDENMTEMLNNNLIYAIKNNQYNQEYIEQNKSWLEKYGWDHLNIKLINDNYDLSNDDSKNKLLETLKGIGCDQEEYKISQLELKNELAKYVDSSRIPDKITPEFIHAVNAEQQIYQGKFEQELYNQKCEKKLFKYKEIMNLQKFIENEDNLNNKIENATGDLAILNEEGYEDYLKIYNYLKEENSSEIDDYIASLKNEFNKYKGIKNAQNRINGLVLDENGNLSSEGLSSIINACENLDYGLGDGIYDWAEGFPKMFMDGEVTAQDYETMYYLQYLQEHSMVQDDIYKVGQGVGMMVPPILIGQVAGGVAGVAGASEATAASVASNVSTAAIGISSFGTIKNEKLHEGYSEMTALAYALAAAGSDAILENKLGGIVGLNTNAAAGQLSLTLKESIKNYLESMFEEGIEEIIQDSVRSGLWDTIILGKELDVVEIMESAPETFIQSALVAGVLNGGTLTLKTAGKNIVIGIGDLKKAYEQGGNKGVQDYLTVKIDTNDSVNISEGAEIVDNNIQEITQQETTPQEITAQETTPQETNNKINNIKTNAANVAKGVGQAAALSLGSMAAVSGSIPLAAAAVPVMLMSATGLQNTINGNTIKNSIFTVYRDGTIQQNGILSNPAKIAEVMSSKNKMEYFKSEAFKMFKQLKQYDENGNLKTYKTKSQAITLRLLKELQSKGYITNLKYSESAPSRLITERLTMGNLDLKNINKKSKMYNITFNLTGKNIDEYDQNGTTNKKIETTPQETITETSQENVQNKTESDIKIIGDEKLVNQQEQELNSKIDKIRQDKDLDSKYNGIVSVEDGILTINDNGEITNIPTESSMDVLVHSTDFFPKNNTVLTTNDGNLKYTRPITYNDLTKQVTYNSHRHTTHYTINNVVKPTGDGAGSWSQPKFIILEPLLGHKEQFAHINPSDSWTYGSLKLGDKPILLVREDAINDIPSSEVSNYNIIKYSGKYDKCVENILKILGIELSETNPNYSAHNYSVESNVEDDLNGRNMAINYLLDGKWDGKNPITLSENELFEIYEISKQIQNWQPFISSPIDGTMQYLLQNDNYPVDFINFMASYGIVANDNGFTFLSDDDLYNNLKKIKEDLEIINDSNKRNEYLNKIYNFNEIRNIYNNHQELVNNHTQALASNELLSRKMEDLSIEERKKLNQDENYKDIIEQTKDVIKDDNISFNIGNDSIEIFDVIFADAEDNERVNLKNRLAGLGYDLKNDKVLEMDEIVIPLDKSKSMLENISNLKKILNDIHNKINDTSINTQDIEDIQQVKTKPNSYIKKTSYDEDVDVSKVYEGYDRHIKVDDNIEGVLNSINPNEKVILELKDTTLLTDEIINKIPDNVDIQIIGTYIDEYLNNYKAPAEIIAMLENVKYSKDELIDIMKEINHIEEGIDPNWTDKQKALYLYEYLKRNMTYEVPITIGERGNSNRSRIWDTLTGLSEHISTCNGFAMIYQELLKRQGIKCYSVAGKYTKSGAKGAGSHAWNIIEIDGKDYFVDSIWDAQEFSKGIDQTTGFGITDSTPYSGFDNSLQNLLEKGLISGVEGANLYNESDLELVTKDMQILDDYHERDSLRIEKAKIDKIVRNAEKYHNNLTWNILESEIDGRIGEINSLLERQNITNEMRNNLLDELEHLKNKQDSAMYYKESLDRVKKYANHLGLSIEDLINLSYEDAIRLNINDNDSYLNDIYKNVDLSEVSDENFAKKPPVFDSSLLNPIVNELATDLNSKAKKSDIVITPFLESLQSVNALLINKTKRLKTTESIIDKLIRDSSEMALEKGFVEESDLKQVHDNMTDALRYTYLISDENFVSEMDNILNKLNENGYEIIKTSKWDQSEKYRGINTKIRKEINGEIQEFEIQFHTPESFDAKDELTHENYDIRRNPYLPNTLRKDLKLAQIKIEKNVNTPKGVLEYICPYLKSGVK